MKRHYCPMEHAWVSFENECNWCGEKEMGKTEDDYDDLWGPTDEDTRGDYGHDIQRQKELDDADWPTDS